MNIYDPCGFTWTRSVGRKWLIRLTFKWVCTLPKGHVGPHTDTRP